jgi:hypothetical protein
MELDQDGAVSGHVSQLTQLTNLQLVHSAYNQPLPLLPALRSLSIDCVGKRNIIGLAENDMQAIGQLTALTSLAFESVPFVAHAFHHVVNLPQLRKLSLFTCHRNGFDRSVYESVGRMTQLQQLGVSAGRHFSRSLLQNLFDQRIKIEIL